MDHEDPGPLQQFLWWGSPDAGGGVCEGSQGGAGHQVCGAQAGGADCEVWGHSVSCRLAGRPVGALQCHVWPGAAAEECDLQAAAVPVSLHTGVRLSVRG